MFISLNWIQDFVELPEISVHDIANDLTVKTAEVEGVEESGSFLKKVRVAEIKSLKPHPEADRLNLVTFDFGDKDPKEVVCGAPNVRPGLKVPYAPIGTTLPGGFTLVPKKIRGVLSDGMLCSEKELALGEGTAGLMELPDSAPIGQDMGEFLDQTSDAIIDIDNKSLTHRPDLWGMYGFAREFAAIYQTDLKNLYNDEWRKNLESQFETSENPISLNVSPESSCLGFWSLAVDGVKVESSPKWMVDRLEALGVRSINSVVDISNYVMLELGMPLHIYDRTSIEGEELNIALAKEGTAFVTLDEQERKLVATDTVISDGKKPVVLAGVMGGLNSGVEDKTTKVLIEVANWQATQVRKTSTRLGLRTESSMRYEKSLDSQLLYRTLLRTLDLLLQLNPDAKVVGKPNYAGPSLTDYRPLLIETSTAKINKVLGTEHPEKVFSEIFSRLGFGVESADSRLMITVPSYRSTKDIEIEADLIEEIGRMLGYDSLPVESPLSPILPVQTMPVKRIEKKVHEFFSRRKFYEIFTYPLVGKRLLKKTSWPTEMSELKLINSLSEDADRMRSSLLPSLLEAIQVNAKNSERFSLFEWGRTYHLDGDGQKKKEKSGGAFQWAAEKRIVGLVNFGRDENRFIETLNTADDFLESFKLGHTWEEDLGKFKNPFLPENWSGVHPYETLHLKYRGKFFGTIFSVHPVILKDLKIKGQATIAILDLSPLCESELKTKLIYKPLGKFPQAFFDCSVLVDFQTPAAEVLKVAKKLKLKEMTDLSIVNVFELNDQHRSVTIRATFESDEKTLPPEWVKEAGDKLVNELAKLGFELKA